MVNGDGIEEGYTTKDSGKRMEFDTGMQRDTSKDKPRFDLITPEELPYKETILYRWAMLMMRGAKKYNERNWEKAKTLAELRRFKDSAFRHFIQWFCEADDGEDHAVAVMFNISGAEYVKWRQKNE